MLPFYLEVLKSNFEVRKKRNPRYSLRAYAKALGVDHAVLSRLLSGKRPPSKKVIERIMASLKLPDEQAIPFLQSASESRKMSRIGKVVQDQKTTSFSEPPIELSHEEFERVSKWYYGAILEFSSCPKFKNDPLWISECLGITPAEAALAIKDLVTYDLLKETPEGVRKTGKWCISKDRSRTSEALITRQKDLLNRAISSLDMFPIERRNHTDMTMAIDPKRIGEAKRMIQEFMECLSVYLESGTEREIFQLNVALFPLEGKLKDSH